MTVGARRNSEARRRRRLRQRQRMLPHIHALRAELFDTFPQVFFREPAQVQPLKKGIAQDIRAVLSASSYVVHGALHWYMEQTAYLRALAEGRPRIDLLGQGVGSVSPAEKEQAIAQLKARQQRRRRKT
jgi:sRNA-binding protein